MNKLAQKNINARIIQKIDSAPNWKTNNTVLLAGELGIESNTGLVKIGNGTTPWNSLSYINSANALQSNSAIATTTDQLNYFEDVGVPVIFDAH